MTCYLALLTYWTREVRKPCISLHSYSEIYSFHCTLLYNTQVKIFCMKLFLKCYQPTSMIHLQAVYRATSFRTVRSLNNLQLSSPPATRELYSTQLLWMNARQLPRWQLKAFVLKMLHNCLKWSKEHEETLLKPTFGLTYLPFFFFLKAIYSSILR